MTTSQRKRVLEGQPFRVGYGDYSPSCIIESKTPLKLSGLLVDIVKLFAMEANLTVEFQAALPGNEGIWGKR